MSLSDFFKSSILLLLLGVTPLQASIQVLLDNGEFSEAEAQILQQLEQQPDNLRQIKLMTLYGDLWFYQYEFDQAMDWYVSALKITENLEDVALQAEQMKNIAITYSERRQYDKALQWHERAIGLLGGDNINNTSMSILLSQAMIFNHVGAQELAAETLAKAQNVAFQLDNHTGLNNSYLRLAHLYLKKKQYPAAQNRLEEVNLNALSDMNNLLWYYLLSTEVALRLNDLEKAELLLKQFDGISNGSAYQNNPAINTLAVQLKISQGQFDLAVELIADLEQAGGIEPWLIQSLYGQLRQAQKQHIEAFKANQKAIDLYYAAHQNSPNEGVYIPIPNELLTQVVSSALKVGFNDLQKLFNWLVWLYQSEQAQFNHHSSTAPSVSERVSEGYQEVLTDVNSGHKQWQQQSRYDLAAIQSVLDSDEGMIFMIAVGDMMLALMIDSEQVRLIELMIDVELLQQQINQYTTQILTNEDWVPLAHKLDEAVILPLRSHGLDQYHKLHIIPDEILRFLPFDALIDQQGKWLLDRHAVNLHSIHSLFEFVDSRTNNQPQHNDTSRLSFVGTSATLSEVPSYWRTAYRNISFEQQYFKCVEQEHQLIKSMKLKGEIKLNEYATESNAIDLIASETGILHFASHGFDNPVAPAFSALLLTAGEHGDGLLQAREVAQLSSDLSLVVLASCSSAKGGLPGRYGFQLGLSEAFLQAGADAVIGTLWDVKDQKTFYFMQWFYAYLTEVGQPAKALQLAKQQAISEHWQLADWSAFVILGDGSINLTLNTEPTAKPSWFYPLCYLIAVAMLLLILIKIKKPRTKN